MKEFKVEKQNIEGVYKIISFQIEDDRGRTIKDYSEKVYQELGIDFVPRETMRIKSKKNVLRGLHCQKYGGQEKLIQCIMGEIFTVVVDLREDSETYLQTISYRLKENDGMSILIPTGCALGTLALKDSVLDYKCDKYYRADYDIGIIWNDEKLAIDWPSVGNILISKKDSNWKRVDEKD